MSGHVKIAKLGLAVSGAGCLEFGQHPHSLALEGLLALECVQRTLHCTSGFISCSRCLIFLTETVSKTLKRNVPSNYCKEKVYENDLFTGRRHFVETCRNFFLGSGPTASKCHYCSILFHIVPS
jgi:hypothetical protein